MAETLSKAKNTSVGGMVEAGIVAASHGKVRLLRPAELPGDWDPAKDKRLTAWEAVHHLVRVLEAEGEGCRREAGRRAGDAGGDGPRAGVPAVHGVRAEEARGGGFGV